MNNVQLYQTITSLLVRNQGPKNCKFEDSSLTVSFPSNFMIYPTLIQAQEINLKSIETCC